MIDIDPIVNKSIDPSENKKQIELVSKEFKQKYDEIIKIKDDPSSEQYHKLYDELWELHNKHVDLVRG